MAAMQTVKKYDGVPFHMNFDGGCPTSMWVGSIATHFVNIDSTLLLTVDEYSISFTSNHSEFLKLLCVLEILIE